MYKRKHLIEIQLLIDTVAIHLKIENNKKTNNNNNKFNNSEKSITGVCIMIMMNLC